MIELTIKGHIPSKKNSKQVIHRGGRMFFVTSKAYKEWNEEHLPELFSLTSLTSVNKITILIYAKDKRKNDLTNKAESIMDLLVDANVIQDDNWYIVPEISLKFGGVDRENPRAEVFIENS